MTRPGRSPDPCASLWAWRRHSRAGLIPQLPPLHEELHAADALAHALGSRPGSGPLRQDPIHEQPLRVDPMGLIWRGRGSRGCRHGRDDSLFERVRVERTEAVTGTEGWRERGRPAFHWHQLQDIQAFRWHQHTACVFGESPRVQRHSITTKVSHPRQQKLLMKQQVYWAPSCDSCSEPWG